MVDENKPPVSEILVMFTPKYDDEGTARTNALILEYDYVTRLQSGPYVFSVPKPKEAAALKQLNDLNSVAWAAPRDSTLEERCAIVNNAFNDLRKLRGENLPSDQYRERLSAIVAPLQNYLRKKK